MVPEGVSEATPARGQSRRRRPPMRRTPRPRRPPPRPGTGRWPVALPVARHLELPETLRYRLKNTLLGPPLASERQSTERLGKPTALAVLSSDVISSSAYATEQILLHLIKAIGVAAFSLVCR